MAPKAVFQKNRAKWGNFWIEFSDLLYLKCFISLLWRINNIFKIHLKSDFFLI